MVGLTADTVAGILLIYTLELNLAVVVTNTVSASVRLALIAVTQQRAVGYERRIRVRPSEQGATGVRRLMGMRSNEGKGREA